MDLTYPLEQQADVMLNRVFQEEITHFAIWPPDGVPFETSPRIRLAVNAGIRNMAQDQGNHQFLVTAKPVSGPEDATHGLTLPRTPKMIAFNTTATEPIIITILETATPGTYTFRITACTDIPATDPHVEGPGEDCPAEYPNVWEEPKDFVLEVLSG